MIKRWCRAAGLSCSIGNHSFRASGITIYRKRGGDLRVAQLMAGHANISTTAIYDHSADDVMRAEIEGVKLLGGGRRTADLARVRCAVPGVVEV
jgi:site-specific recombinase XerD